MESQLQNRIAHIEKRSQKLLVLAFAFGILAAARRAPAPLPGQAGTLGTLRKSAEDAKSATGKDRGRWIYPVFTLDLTSNSQRKVGFLKNRLNYRNTAKVIETKQLFRADHPQTAIFNYRNTAKVVETKQVILISQLRFTSFFEQLPQRLLKTKKLLASS